MEMNPQERLQEIVDTIRTLQSEKGREAWAAKYPMTPFDLTESFQELSLRQAEYLLSLPFPAPKETAWDRMVAANRRKAGLE